MGIKTTRAQRCDPINRERALLGVASEITCNGQCLSARAIATRAGVSASLVKHYLYPLQDLRRRLVDEAVAANDPRRLAPLLTWPEAKTAPAALRRAAAQELAR